MSARWRKYGFTAMCQRHISYQFFKSQCQRLQPGSYVLFIVQLSANERFNCDPVGLSLTTPNSFLLLFHQTKREPGSGDLLNFLVALLSPYLYFASSGRPYRVRSSIHSIRPAGHLQRPSAVGKVPSSFALPSPVHVDNGRTFASNPITLTFFVMKFFYYSTLIV